MKKIIFMAAFALSSTLVHAQLSWDVRIGANLSGVENSKANQKLGLKVGGGAQFAFSKLFALRSSLYYTTKGVSLEGAKFGFFPDNALKINYMEFIPVSPAFRFRLTDSFALLLHAGPYLALRLSRQNAAEFERLRSFDAGLNAGLDFEIRRFIVGIDAGYGFVPLVAKGPKLHNINYSLTLGYRIGGR